MRVWCVKHKDEWAWMYGLGNENSKKRGRFTESYSQEKFQPMTALPTLGVTSAGQVDKFCGFNHERIEERMNVQASAGRRPWTCLCGRIPEILSSFYNTDSTGRGPMIVLIDFQGGAW